MTTLNQIEKALKEVLLSKPKDTCAPLALTGGKVKYENKKPSKIEKNHVC